MKGFYAKTLVQNNGCLVNEIVYMKIYKYRPYFHTPILYKIINEQNGSIRALIDANEFKNRFEKLNA